MRKGKTHLDTDHLLSRGLTFSVNEWAKDPMNKKAWVEIMKQSKDKITFSPLEKNIEDILGVGNVLSLLTPTVSMNKAKIFEWTGYFDTFKSSFNILLDMEKLGMRPAVKVDAARPMI